MEAGDSVYYHGRVNQDEARRIIIDAINYAAQKEADSSLRDADKNRLFGSEHYGAGRGEAAPSPWQEGDFEENMASLLRWANELYSSDPALEQAQELLEGEDSVLGRVIRRSRFPGERDLPRWVQVPAGIVLGLVTIFCIFALLSLWFSPNKPSPVLAAIVFLVLLAGCALVLEKCFRLLTGRKRKGGLMSPTALRVVAFCALLMPIAGIFTGYYKRMGALAFVQAAAYVLAFFGLRALARKREQQRLVAGTGGERESPR